MDPDIDAQAMYNNGHRAFLQAFMSRGSMTFANAKPILAKVLTIQEGRQVQANDIMIEDFMGFIDMINSKIHAFDMEISYTYPQTATSRTPNDAIYALVNLSSDPQTQLATTHKPEEIAFVRRVLDGIFDTNNTRAREVMAIRGMDAINLAKPRGGRDSAVGTNGNNDGETQSTQANNTALTKAQAEKTLASLVQEGWLERSRGGYYTLSPRGLIELKGWLVETYNDDEEEDDEEGPVWQRIKTCNGCKETITVGQRCANGDCTCRYHDFCAANFLNNSRDKKCPMCKTEWSTSNYVGERAVNGPRASRGAAPVNRQSTTNSGRQSTADEEDDDDESETE